MFKIFLMFILIKKTIQIEIITYGATIALLGAMSKKPYCYYKECCNINWYNKTVDLSDLSKYIYGQDHILNIAGKAIKNHINTKNPIKPLVIALIGPPGTGKNYFMDLIAKRLFYLGTKSKYVKTIIGTQHFIQNRTINEYQQIIMTTLKSIVSKCPERSLFLFDEIDKFPDGVINLLKPVFDNYNQIDGIDFRKSIFILVGNRGQNEISNFVYDYFKRGIDRKNLPHYEIEKILKSVLYYNPSNSVNQGLTKSNIIKNSLIDIYLPFYPLERSHIIQCIEWEIKNLNYLINIEDCTEKVIKYLEFYPSENPIFSLDGCKKIHFLTNTFC